jgi:hypothetical protein
MPCLQDSKKMGRVEIEPMTSALYRLCKMAVDERELNCSISSCPLLFFCILGSLASSGNFNKKAIQGGNKQDKKYVADFDLGPNLAEKIKFPSMN